MSRARLFLPLLLVPVLALGACGSDPAVDDAFPAVGDKAPDFTLVSADGGTVALSDFTGEKPVLLYFSMGPG